MVPQLSNAVSHAFFQVLDAKIHHTWWKCFLPILSSTFWEWMNAIFTLYWFLKWHCLLPKGQQKLTRFSDLVEEGLSYLQLFLELPETVWSLQNRLYIKKHHFSCNMSPFVKPNLAFGLMRSWVRVGVTDPSCLSVFGDFFIHGLVWSDQMVSESPKNSWR